MTADPADRLRSAFGFRVVARIGPVRLLRVLAALAVICAFAWWLGHWGWNVAAIGQDTWNYIGAGERLNAGHPLYELVAGDRPIILDPGSTVPITSPPLVAALWRPLALLPDWLAMWGWWAASAAALLATTMWIVVKGRWQAIVVVFVLATVIGECAASGNLNSFLVPAMAFSWWSVQVARPRIAGSLTALGAMLKIGPAALLLWFAVRREGTAITTFAATAAALVAVSILGAGLRAQFDFLSVARTSTDSALWGGSVPGILSQLKASQGLIELSIPAVWIVGAALVWLLRHRPAEAFVVVVVLVIWGTPVVHLTAVALLLAAAAPWTPAPAWLGRPAATTEAQAI